MSTIGKYYMEYRNDGAHIIHVYNPAINTRESFVIPNLEAVLEQAFEPYLWDRRECVRLFWNAFYNMDHFLNSPDADIIKYMPDYSGDQLFHASPDQRFEMHIRAVVAGYNAWKGKDVNWRDVLPYLHEYKQDFHFPSK